MVDFDVGNVSGANQPLRANYENFNLDRQINIQIVKLSNPPCPLDVDPMIQIEVFIICTKWLICT